MLRFCVGSRLALGRNLLFLRAVLDKAQKPIDILEILIGELSNLRQAILPIGAAVGGMIVPAGFYLIFNSSGPAVNGWGIPMATDIAFAVGALSLLGARVPKNLVTFLIALARGIARSIWSTCTVEKVIGAEHMDAAVAADIQIASMEPVGQHRIEDLVDQGGFTGTGGKDGGGRLTLHNFMDDILLALKK